MRFRTFVLTATWLLLQACSSGGGKEASTDSAPAAPADSVAQGQAGAFAPPTVDGPPGSVEGVVLFQGAPPAPMPLKRGFDPACANGEPNDTAILVKDGKLANVVIQLKGAALKPGEAPSAPALVDQRGCTYAPRVQAIVAGQKLQVQNSDPTLHNVHGYVGRKTVSNHAQPPSSPPIEQTYDASAEVLRLSCDVHPWMVAHVFISPHRYVAVSAADGRFEIPDVPPGTYSVEAWHEKLGRRTGQVTVSPGQQARVELHYGAG